MNKIYILLLVANFLLAKNTIETNTQHEINFSFDNINQIEGSLAIGDIEYSLISINQNEYLRLNIPNSYHSTTVGSPELPQLNQLIEIPKGASYYIEIINDEKIEFDLNSIKNNIIVYPSQPSISKSDRSQNKKLIINNEIYNKDSSEFQLIKLQNKGTLREVQIGNLMISPIEYNPLSNKLIIHKNIEFVIHFQNINSNLSKTIKEEYFSPYFETIYQSSLINYNANFTRDNDFIHDQVTYLIIADQTFNGYLDEFIDWKTKKGYNVITAYTNEIGSSASSIRSFIQQNYSNPSSGLSPVSFVLLVGDTAQIPASYSSGGHVSDLDYCDMTNDNLPDILCGRFSAQSPIQLAAQIEKTLEYEKYEMPDPSFLGDVIMISGVDASYAPTYGNGQINYGNSYYFNSSEGINSNTFLYPASGSSGSQILNLANQGAAFINYTAHGYEEGWADPSFVNSDVNNMSNNNKYPTMVGNCCLTNAFDSGTCFGEALLRKSNGGAIGYIGGSDVTYWNEDYWWGVGNGSITANPTYGATGEGAYDGMFHNNNENNWAIVNAAIMMVGNLAVVEAGSSFDAYYWEIYHLMGDPSISTYMGIPSTNVVEHPVFIAPGSTEITINAEPFSYVGITKNNELIGSGLINQFGIGIIDLSNTNDPGDATIIVTGQNLQPYTGTIIISTPDGPYVSMNDVSVNSGNDNMISLGESIIINVELENFGSEAASDILVELSNTSQSPYINIIDENTIINNLQEGDTTSAFLGFNVSNSAPYGHSFILSVSLESENNSYSIDFDLTAEQLIESFETGNFSDMNWQLSGNASWSIDSNNSSNGSYSAKSGTIGNNTISSLEINVEVVEDGFISFNKKVSCEAPGSISGNYYDYLAFFIDNIEQAKWAGELDWSQSAFNISEGEHSLKWTFIKDQDSSDNVESGQDAVWIDNIAFPAVFSDNAMIGDVNGDTNINVQDIIVIVNTILSNQNNTAADVNQDGNIDVLDIVQVVNLILEN